jgi:hypothetical protein
MFILLLMIINKGIPAAVASALTTILHLAGLLSCEPDRKSGDENGMVMEMAGGLPGGKAYEIDSVQSEILWTIRKSDGSFLKGRFKPGKGFVLLEGNSLAAGFIEGDLWKNITLTDSLNAPSLNGMKFLKDSIPQFFSSDGRKIRFDLKQTSRVIPRSEFRSTGGLQDSLLPTHDLQFQAEIADSSQAIRLPLRLQMEKKRVRLNGNFQLNLREFGILSRQISTQGKVQWIPEAGLEFRLLFRESN